MSNGILLYRGPSRLDGSPIVAILTGLERPSSNVKTGPSIQLWICPDPAVFGLPHEHRQHGGACGDCRHQPEQDGTCYVTLFQGLRSICDALLRGVYPAAPSYPGALRDVIHGAQCHGADLLRLGAWGDPAALPLALLRRLIEAATWNGMGHTGYTHAWRRFPGLRSHLMASVDTAAERQDAQAKGWRTFAVLPLGAERQGTDVICPATVKAGVTCNACRMCDGTSERDPLTGERQEPTRMRSIAVVAHGARASAVKGDDVVRTRHDTDASMARKAATRQAASAALAQAMDAAQDREPRWHPTKGWAI